jgi:UDP-2,3-diacylglucosamine pyrophosphatase LpxH
MQILKANLYRGVFCMMLQRTQKSVKLVAASLICLFTISIIATAGENKGPDFPLKFRPDGMFKIVQFTDIQDGPDMDPRTDKLMNNVLDYEKPDLVVLTGDYLDGKCKSVQGVKKAINNIAQPMEKRQIPWGVVFGNHDEEQGQMTESEMLNVYMTYPHNLSRFGPDNVDGTGNYNLLVSGSKDKRPVFNIYMLDSGRYSKGGVGVYDWIKTSQIEWYRNTCLSLKKQYNKTIPALMFFHIPVPEFKQIWESGKAKGTRNESVDAPLVNSGLFTSAIEMGDVKGIFVGHDHTNDYIGELYGIRLGYSRNTGFGTYGKDGFSRGARVFVIKESDPEHFDTWMRLATDF